MVIESKSLALGGKLNFNMKIDKFLILITLFILGLSFATYWQFKNFQNSLSEVKFPKFEMPKFEIPFFPKDEGYKEFISPDGKLKLKYSSGWMEMTKENLESFNQEKTKENVLFFVQKLKIEKAALAFLIVQESERGTNIEEIIEEMKKETMEMEGEMEILSLEKENKGGYLEAKYKRKGSIFHSKEKIILGENKFYVISIIALEKDWPEFKDEADEILNSIELL